MLSYKHWGVRPVLFCIHRQPVPSYSFFVALALILGISVFIIEAYRNNHFDYKTWCVLCAALVFGSLGAKLPIWIGHFREILKAAPNVGLLGSGRTIVGGLIGGVLGVMMVKHLFKIEVRLGNEIAPGLAIGLAVGRIGCLLQGCCYGLPTHANWGVDFGDGILRYPTQIIESTFGFALFIVLLRLRKKIGEPGRLFFIFLTAYLVFRFLIEFLRFNRYEFAGLSVFQWTSIAALLVLYRQYILKRFLDRGRSKPQNIS